MNQPQVTFPIDPFDLVLAVLANTVHMAGLFAAAMPWWAWPLLAVACLLRFVEPPRRS